MEDNPLKNYYYVLTPEGEVRHGNMQEIADQLGDSQSRRVAETFVEGFRVSTVFLCIDHAFDGGIPLLFETMVFNSDGDAVNFEEMDAMQHISVELLGIDIFKSRRRYPTKTGAEEGHAEIVKDLQAVFASLYDTQP